MSSCYFTPTLDKLLRDRKIDKVPYPRISEKWFPKVGNQCWNYARNDMFTVVVVDSRAKNIMLRWGFGDVYETVSLKDMPRADIVFLDWEFDKMLIKPYYKWMTYPYTYSVSDFIDICKDGINETSIRGAEIRTLCAMGFIPEWVAMDLREDYLNNTAKYKINDRVYYWVDVNVSARRSRLIRDTDKSPRKYSNNGDSTSANNDDDSSAPILPQSEQYRANDESLQQLIQQTTSANGIGVFIGNLANWLRRTFTVHDVPNFKFGGSRQ